MATGAVSGQRQAVPIRHRPSISEMTAPQLAELRVALAKLQSIDDDRGYQRWAGVHGLPVPMYCDQAHGQPAFLPWHRAYLYRFEQALRDTGHDVMLPWWDWTKVRQIPAAYDEPKRPDGTPNPMYSVRINDLALRQAKEGRAGRDRGAPVLARYPETFRQPGLPGSRLPTVADIEKVLAYTDFPRFTSKLEDWHGEVHVWVGGHMSDIPFAAYDPIFWAHHCMIDRIWRIWQLHHPSGSFPEALRGEVMEPFHLTAGKVLDPTALGYDYSLSIAQVRP
jgi:tyrosinase